MSADVSVAVFGGKPCHFTDNRTLDTANIDENAFRFAEDRGMFLCPLDRSRRTQRRNDQIAFAEQFIRQRILSPLGMSSTGFGDTWSGGGSVVYSDEAYYRWFAYKGLCRGCGDMMSNAEDLAKWGVELCAHNLISDNIFRQMTAARVFGSEYNYGYGLMLCDDYIYHDGNLPPFCTTLSVLPAQGFVFVLLDCGDNSPLFDVREQIFTNSTYQ